jgi:three-Cys-motif partner protein
MLYSNVKEWSDDSFETTEKHDVWSMKKLIPLDYYVGPFTQIMRSAKFERLYYVDPFAGSGLIRVLDKYRFPGSPLVPLFRYDEAPFDKYYLSDIKASYLTSLGNRIKRIQNDRKFQVYITKKPFKEAANSLFTGIKPRYWKSAGYLVFLDPFGFEQVDWNSMKRILTSGAVDIIFTFMTFAIVWNRDNEQSKKSLNEFFGDTEWQKLNKQEEYLKYYCDKIESLGYMNKYKTVTIDVIMDGGRRYDLILATQSLGGVNVLRDLKERVKAVTPDLLHDAFEATVGNQREIDSYVNREGE